MFVELKVLSDVVGVGIVGLVAELACLWVVGKVTSFRIRMSRIIPVCSSTAESKSIHDIVAN